jgi:hypothetical protein
MTAAAPSRLSPEAADFIASGLSITLAGRGEHCLALAERDDEVRQVVAAIQRQQPGYRAADLLAAFRFADDAVEPIRRVAGRIEMA